MKVSTLRNPTQNHLLTGHEGLVKKDVLMSLLDGMDFNLDKSTAEKLEAKEDIRYLDVVNQLTY